MQTDVIRSEQLNVKLSADERARLQRLAEHYSVSEQNVVRMLIKRAADELGIEREPSRKAPRGKR